MNTIQNALLLMTEIELLKKEVLMLTQKLENMTEANMLNARALRLNKEKLTAAQATLERLLVELAVLAATIRDDDDRKYISSIATLPNDTTALQERLRQAKVDVLREAAEKVDLASYTARQELLRMADEIEKGEQ